MGKRADQVYDMEPRPLDVLRVILGHFCKERRLFPDACFTLQRIDDDCDKVYVFNTPPLADRGAEYLHDIIEHGVAECLERGCLRSIALCIHDTTNASMVEKLLIECDSIFDESWRPTLGQVVQDITRRQRLVVQTLSQLPKEVSVGVRLNIISAKMPYPAWTPPFFHSSCARFSCDATRGEETTLSLSVGRFRSSNHVCSVVLQSLQDSLEELEFHQRAGSDPFQIAFDPEFTETGEPKTTFSQYEQVKTLVASCVMLSNQKTHRPLMASIPSLRLYLRELRDGSMIERQGVRYCPSKCSKRVATEKLESITQGARKKQVRSSLKDADATSGRVESTDIFAPVHPIVQKSLYIQRVPETIQSAAEVSMPIAQVASVTVS